MPEHWKTIEMAAQAIVDKLQDIMGRGGSAVYIKHDATETVRFIVSRGWDRAECRAPFSLLREMMEHGYTYERLCRVFPYRLAMRLA